MVHRTQRTAIQRLSKLAFNSDHRLTIACELLRRQADLFDKGAIEQATGVPSTSVYNELRDMTELGLLTEVADGNRLVFSVVPSPFWSWCQALLEGVEEPDKAAT